VTTYQDLTFSGSGTNTITCVATSVTRDLTLSGTSAWTLTANLAVGRNLSVGAGTSITVGAFTFLTTGTSTIDGTLTLNSDTGNKTLTGLVTVDREEP